MFVREIFAVLPTSNIWVLSLCFDVMIGNDWLDPEAIEFKMYCETYDVVSPSLAYEDKIALAMLLVILWNTIHKGSLYKDAVKYILQHLLNHETLEESFMDSFVLRNQANEANHLNEDKISAVTSAISTLVELTNNSGAHLLKHLVSFVTPFS